MKTITIINGPNLNLLGQRETEIYGSQSFEDYLRILRDEFHEIDISYFQSNVEGEIINKIQSSSSNSAGIIINPGGYSHTSVAIRDAIASVSLPIIEVHISNLYKREDFRQNCLTAGACQGLISGLGLQGYRSAIQFILSF